jgi:hypothetical protein
VSIVTQYGVRITDRVQIVSDPAAGEYIVKFDGEEIGRAHSGPHGIRVAQDWLKGRQARREAEEQREKEEEAEREARRKAQEEFDAAVKAEVASELKRYLDRLANGQLLSGLVSPGPSLKGVGFEEKEPVDHTLAKRTKRLRNSYMNAAPLKVRKARGKPK